MTSGKDEYGKVVYDDLTTVISNVMFCSDGVLQLIFERGNTDRAVIIEFRE